MRTITGECDWAAVKALATPSEDKPAPRERKPVRRPRTPKPEPHDKGGLMLGPFRRKLGLTVEELAREAGCSATLLRGLESGLVGLADDGLWGRLETILKTGRRRLAETIG